MYLVSCYIHQTLQIYTLLMIIFSMLEEIDRSTVPEDCTVKQEGCKQRVVLKADETKPCIAEVAVVGRK